MRARSLLISRYADKSGTEFINRDRRRRPYISSRSPERCWLAREMRSNNKSDLRAREFIRSFARVLVPELLSAPRSYRQIKTPRANYFELRVRYLFTFICRTWLIDIILTYRYNTARLAFAFVVRTRLYVCPMMSKDWLISCNIRDVILTYLKQKYNNFTLLTYNMHYTRRQIVLYIWVEYIKYLFI